MRFSIGLLAGVLMTSAYVSAQVRYRPTEPGPWRPWSFTAIPSARQSRSATAADVQRYQARLQELAAIVRRAPAVAQPIGFAAEAWGHLAGFSPGPGTPPANTVPLAGSLSFAAFPLIEFTRNGRVMNEDMKGGETEVLQFAVNQIDASVYTSARPIEWGSHEIDAFLEPHPGEPVAGLARLNDVFVFKKNPKPLWSPLPLEDALTPVIGELRSRWTERRDAYAKQVAEFTTWQTPAKRAERRADWQRAAASMPNGAEFVANMEKSDAAIEAMNQQRLAVGGPEERGAKDAERELQAATRVLDSRTPAQRRGPSCYQSQAASGAERFQPASGGEGSACRALVTPNWAYFDTALPRSAPQLLVISGFARCLAPESLALTSRGGCVVNRELISSLDWNAVRDWLDR